LVCQKRDWHFDLQFAQKIKRAASSAVGATSL
jgi:hypothetical protein